MKKMYEEIEVKCPYCNEDDVDYEDSLDEEHEFEDYDDGLRDKDEYEEKNKKD